MTLTQHYITLI